MLMPLCLLFSPHEVCGVCLRAWVGGRVVVFTKYGWKKFTRNTRQNGVSSPALMADVMR